MLLKYRNMTQISSSNDLHKDARQQFILLVFRLFESQYTL